jgi:putative SOS response-associated peptidase YedK
VCGRAQYLKVPEIVEAFGPARPGDVDEAALTDESFPGSTVPGLVLHDGARVVSSFAWAFFEDGTGHNARLETAADRPAWRDAYRSARLVLPLVRFVEGRAWFADPAGGPLAVAGLYRLGRTRRATMLTRPADTAVTPYHDRMPVILPADLVAPWLAGEAMPVDRLLGESCALVPEPVTRAGPPPPDQLTLL